MHLLVSHEPLNHNRRRIRSSLKHVCLRHSKSSTRNFLSYNLKRGAYKTTVTQICLLKVFEFVPRALPPPDPVFSSSQIGRLHLTRRKGQGQRKVLVRVPVLLLRTQHTLLMCEKKP
jgi:hypothetical protein